MTTEMYIIAISAVILIALVLVRYFGLGYAKGEMNPRFLNTSDNGMRNLGHSIHGFISQSIGSFSYFVKTLPKHFLHLVHVVLNISSKKTEKWVHLVKGKNIQTNRGSVSLYLKQLEEDR